MDISELSEGNNFEESVAKHINAIKGDGKQLPCMVESMGHILTHKDPDTRGTGVKFMTRVLQGLPHNTLGEEQATTLLRYYTSRLEDHPSMVTWAIQGIYELVVSQGLLESTEIEHLLQVIFYDVQMPGLLQAERYVIYRMLTHMLISHASVLRKMGSKFVLGCIQAMEGERDPRCLLQVFAIVPMLCNEFILGDLEEPLFDVCSCYFPVDFNPPATDPGRISREELADSLLNCLTASPGFGKHCVPLAAEKLESDLLTAKLDSLKLLSRGSQVFPPQCFRDHTVTIWKQIHSLVFVNRHDAIIPAALTCLTSLARVVSSDQKDATSVNGLFKLVWKDLQRGEAPGMGKVLEAFACASARACLAVLSETLPDLLQLLSRNEGLRPVLVMESTTALLSLYASLCHHEETSRDLSLKLSLLTDQLCVLVNDDSNPELAVRAAGSLCATLAIPGLLTATNLDVIRSTLVRVATQDVAPPVGAEHGDLLAAAVRLNLPLADSVLSLLKEEICRGYHPTKTERVLRMSTACASNTVSLSFMLPSLTESFVSSFRDNRAPYQKLLAKYLLDVVCRAEKCGTTVHHAALLRSVVAAWIESVGSEQGTAAIEDFVEASSLVQKLAQMCSASDVREIYSTILETCLKANIPSQPLLLLVQSVIYHMPRDAMSADERLVQLLSDGRLHDSSHLAGKCLAGLVNKLTAGDVEKVLQCLQSSWQPQWTLAKADLLLWVTKGLLLRGYPDLAKYTNLLEQLLRDENVGRHTAEGFDVILQPIVLTSEGHCVLRLLHPQRFFVETAPILIQGFNSATNKAVKDNFLMALCCQLKYVPKVVVNSYIDKVLPILVDALSSAEVLVVGQCVLPCLTENVALLVSCLNSVVEQLLRLAKPPQPMDVRRMSLECLHQLTTTGERELLLHRRNVLRGLTPCLCDRKRVVRQAAAQASSAWHMVGQSIGE
ncbi:unnamed protein product [Ixodes pacificus]